MPLVTWVISAPVAMPIFWVCYLFIQLETPGYTSCVLGTVLVTGL
jgi:hypothetical protein